MVSAYTLIAILAAPAVLASPVPEVGTSPVPRGLNPTSHACYPSGFQNPCKQGTKPPPAQYGCSWYPGNDGYQHECPNWGSGCGWDNNAKQCKPAPQYTCHSNNMWPSGTQTQCISCVPWCIGKGSNLVVTVLDDILGWLGL